MADHPHPVGSFVRERRKASGLTQTELAELAGVGVRFVSDLERGKPTVRLDSTEAVLRVFGKRLSVEDLDPGDKARVGGEHA